MLKKKNKYVVAVVGATGAVGREMVSILEERKFPISELVLLASERTEGERIEFNNKNWTVKKLGEGLVSTTWILRCSRREANEA